MKLFNANLSPFASRCRIQIYAKGLDIPFADPPGGLSSAEYKKLNPTGKVPALQLDDGTVIPESDAICEYLEDRYPEKPMRPADPVDRARMRVLQRVTDNAVIPSALGLFGQLDPKTRNAAFVAEKLAALRPGIDQLEGFLQPGPYAVGASLTLADSTLFPFFFFATRLLPALGDKDPVSDRPKLAAWWEAVRRHDAIARVDGELQEALAKFLSGNR